MSKAETLARYAQQHGFATVVQGGNVAVFIPFTSAEGDGWWIENASTVDEMRAALGY
jgi:hypothetical protein